ncbi:hypothetical protein FDB88_11865 [Clostridium sporogenes]|uniref:DUF6575 domain-containing protein n=1 Tax=Clostridium sporogenes TaxID=1509 RepID=UPI0013D24931|nr:DUF6575 domain-containing protein [Clostridium sporogenes]NFM17883.1 hypothetical protein [Clostridium sporogenes]
MIESDAYMHVDLLGRIYIKDVIIYYDKPLTFACINDFGQLFIASCINIDEIEEWLFVPLTEARLILGLRGNIQAYRMFSEPEGGFLWKIKISASKYTDGRASKILPNELIDDDLPDKDIVYDIYGEDEFLIKSEERMRILDDSVRERREILDVSLEPEHSHIHEIDAEFLGKVLENIQTMVNLISHRKGINAKVPKDIKEKNKLKATGSYAASFGIRLKSNNLANILNESEVQDSLDTFMDILEAKSDVQKLANILDKLNPAVGIHYRNFLKLFNKEDVGIKTYCAFPNSKYRGNYFTRNEIKTSLKNLEEDIKEVKKEVELFGKVVAIDVLNKTFKFIINEDKIQGSIGKDVKIEEYILPKEAKIKLEIISKFNNFTGEENIEYKLIQLEYYN